MPRSSTHPRRNRRSESVLHLFSRQSIMARSTQPAEVKKGRRRFYKREWLPGLLPYSVSILNLVLQAVLLWRIDDERIVGWIGAGGAFTFGTLAIAIAISFGTVALAALMDTIRASIYACYAATPTRRDGPREHFSRSTLSGSVEWLLASATSWDVSTSPSGGRRRCPGFRELLAVDWLALARRARRTLQDWLEDRKVFQGYWLLLVLIRSGWALTYIIYVARATRLACFHDHPAATRCLPWDVTGVPTSLYVIDAVLLWCLNLQFTIRVCVSKAKLRYMCSLKGIFELLQVTMPLPVSPLSSLLSPPSSLLSPLLSRLLPSMVLQLPGPLVLLVYLMQLSSYTTALAEPEQRSFNDGAINLLDISLRFGFMHWLILVRTSYLESLLTHLLEAAEAQVRAAARVSSTPPLPTHSTPPPPPAVSLSPRSPLYASSTRPAPSRLSLSLAPLRPPSLSLSRLSCDISTQVRAKVFAAGLKMFSILFFYAGLMHALVGAEYECASVCTTTQAHVASRHARLVAAREALHTHTHTHAARLVAARRSTHRHTLRPPPSRGARTHRHRRRHPPRSDDAPNHQSSAAHHHACVRAPGHAIGTRSSAPSTSRSTAASPTSTAPSSTRRCSRPSLTGRAARAIQRTPTYAAAMQLDPSRLSSGPTESAAAHASTTRSRPMPVRWDSRSRWEGAPTRTTPRGSTSASSPSSSPRSTSPRASAPTRSARSRSTAGARARPSRTTPTFCTTRSRRSRRSGMATGRRLTTRRAPSPSS